MHITRFVLNLVSVTKMIEMKLRHLFFALWMLMPLANYAQQDTAKIPIPMKQGKIFYQETFSSSKDKSTAFDLAEKWFAKTFPDEPTAFYTADKNAGLIKGVGMFKVITSQTGNYYWLKFDVNIIVADNGCTITTANYFEKPIEKGISNEYSKISYRWWDFRRGHPWSVEDRPLFTGLHQQTLQLITSFKQSITK
jgi:hypothetical protein